MDMEVVTRPPELPSKYDVIPIHSSDVASYKKCRRYWNWTSPARHNLRRRVGLYGVSMPLWFGTGIHYALEKYYDPILRHDPTETFLTWYELQVNGGVVTEDWLERTYDLNPVQVATDLWKVKGLRALLAQYIEEEFEAHKELGIGMMNFYKDYAEKNDDFMVVAAENTYSIPLGFESRDLREESPNYGKMIEVHARGKRDAIIYFPSTEKYALRDYKTAERIDEDYFIKFEKDEQFSNYLWATKMEAKMNGYPWSGKVVDRIACVALRKNYPKQPSITTRGFPSLNRAAEGTTADIFKDLVLSNPKYEDWFREDEKAQAYYVYLCEQGDKMFIEDFMVTRNNHEIEATGNHLRMIATEMLDPKLNIYPNPRGTYDCIRCAFRPPCIAADDGGDVENMLLDGYEENKGR